MTTISISTAAELSEKEKKLAIIDDLNDVVDAIDELITTTTSSTNRRKRVAQVPCSWFEGAVSDLIDIAFDTSEQTNIGNFSTLIKNANVDSCSASEQSTLRTHKESLESIIEDYEDDLNTATSATSTMDTKVSTRQTTFKTTLAGTDVTATTGNWWIQIQ